MERAVIMEETNSLSADSLPYDILHVPDSPDTSRFHLATIEQFHIRKMLQYTNGNKTEAARLMDISLATLYRKIEEYGIK